MSSDSPATAPPQPPPPPPVAASADEMRVIDVGGDWRKSKFAANRIKTTRYSNVPWQPDFFLWKALFEQFQRRANLYFVLISALQLIPGVSPTGRYTTLGTLIVVLLFSMARSFAEDFLRYLQDRKQNSKFATTLNVESQTWESTPVTQIQPGTIVRVSNEDGNAGGNMFPCDCLLLTSSNPTGECLVETSTLDGETNLKTRLCTWQLPHARYFSGDRCTAEFGGAKLVVDPPNADLLSCDGRFQGRDGREVPISINNAAFRGCYLKRTLWCVCVATYTGKETKVMQNRRKKHDGVKRSSVERLVNWLLVVILVILIALCVTCLVFSLVLPQRPFYLGYDAVVQPDSGAVTTGNAGVDAIIKFLTFVVLFNNFIPISLYVSIEIVKLLQGVMMSLDLCMYSEKQDQRCVVRSSELNEELGQITHMLCDKTGTLTKNKMSFRKFAIGGKIFGRGRSNAEQAEQLIRNQARATFYTDSVDPLFVFYDERIPDTADFRGLPEADEVRRLFIAIALCHTVLSDGDKLEAEYPDEETLVHAARKFGVRYVGNRNGILVIEWGSTGIYSHFEVLQVIPFTPHRKRMTIVVRETTPPDDEDAAEARSNSGLFEVSLRENFEASLPRSLSSNGVEPTIPEGHVLVITKGAESVMKQRLSAKGASNPDVALKAEEMLASQGLRTLVVAQKLVSIEEYSRWHHDYTDVSGAVGSFVNVSGEHGSSSGATVSDAPAAPAAVLQHSTSITSSFHSTKQRPVSRRVALEDALESDLEVLGTTALEDKLQNNVMQTLSNLRHAGVKVWMMTGDHASTARKIAFTCGLMGPRDPIVQFHDNSVQSREQLVDALNQNLSIPYAVEIGGDVFGLVFDDVELRHKLHSIFSTAAAVVCSRFSPKQKLQAVELLREFNSNARVLGIGDGANDVPMLEACDVAIGMFGNEGHQAVNASDYAVAEFEFVHRLVLIHGRANYVRLCKMINYFFYKNALLVSTQFWYCIFNYFSGESLYEGLTFALYNVLFTSLPCIVLGVFDRDVLSTDSIHQFPGIYKFGIEGRGLSVPLFVRWVMEGLASSVGIFFLVISGANPGIINNGYVLGEADVGLIIYTAVIVLTTVRIGIEMRSWTTIHMFSMVLSLAFGWIFYFVYGEMESEAGIMYKLSLNIGFKIQVWLIGLNATIISILPTVLVIYGIVRIIPLQRLSLSMLIALRDAIDIDAATRAPMELAGRIGEDDDVRSIFGAAAAAEATRAGGGGQNFKALVGRSGNGLNSIDGPPGGGVRLNSPNPESSKTSSWGVAAGGGTDPNRVVVAGFFSSFDDSQIEANFLEKLVGDLTRYRNGALICFIAASVIVVANGISNVTFDEQIAWGVFAFTALCTFLMFHFARRIVQAYYHSVLLVLCLVGFSCVSIANLKASRQDPDTHPVTLAILMMGMITVTRPPLFHACQYMFIGLLAYAAWYQAFGVRAWAVTDMGLRAIEIIVVSGISLLRLAVREYFLRAVFAADWHANNALTRIAEEEQRSYLLLQSVLPAQIVHAMQRYNLGLSLFNMAFAEGSYLQSDIVMFTRFSSGHESTVVIEMLNRMFTKFDSLSNEYKIEKIKTIGDAYIAAAGIPTPDRYHAQRIALLGLGLHDKMKEMNSEGLSTLRNLDLHVRVGVASGSLVAGVVGKTKVAYDVFGEAKERADVLEQTGLPDRVQCTKEMAEALQEHFTYEVLPGKDGKPGYFLIECTDRSFLGHDSSAAFSDLPHDGHDSHAPLSVAAVAPPVPSSEVDGNPLAQRPVSHSVRRRRSLFTSDSLALPPLHHPQLHSSGAEANITAPSSAVDAEDDSSKCPIPHLEPGLREETYRFLDDDDERRVNFIETWKDFDGERQMVTMAFRKEVAERQFNEEIEHLAVSRSFHDMLLGAAFFALTAIICIMGFVGQQQHPFVLALFGVGILHAIVSVVVEFASTQRRSNLRKGSVWQRTARYDQNGAASVSGKGAVSPGLKMLLKTMSVVSAAAALATSIALPFVFDRSQTSTITVFVTIAATAHAFAFLYFRNVLKLIVLVAHLIATVAIMIANERKRWDSGTSGDIFGIIIAYLFIAIDIVDFEQQVRNNYVVSRRLLVREAGIESAVALSEKLLLNVLPPVIIQKLRTQPDRQVVDVFTSASAMFVYSNVMDIDVSRSADDAIVALNEVVFILDTICRENGAEKIKTAPYLVVCGMPIPKEDHAATLAVCAMKILAATKRYNEEHPDRMQLKVKVGLNSGKISAGVLGKTKFVWDCFGDTVNVASRLASYGKYGTLTIGAETRRALEATVGGLAFIDHGDVELKGKGLVRIQEIDLANSTIPVLASAPEFSAMSTEDHDRNGGRSGSGVFTAVTFGTEVVEEDVD